MNIAQVYFTNPYYKGYKKQSSKENTPSPLSFKGIERSCVYYDPTDRSLNRMTSMPNEDGYPSGFFTDLKGKKVLDIATGGGQFIEDLLANGVDIIGIDKIKSRTLLSKPAEVKERIKTGVDAQCTPFADNSFDVIFSFTGPLSYDGIGHAEEKYVLRLNVLREMCRILKPNGVIRLAPVNYDVMSNLVEQTPKLSINRTDPCIVQKDGTSWLEIKKENG